MYTIDAFVSGLEKIYPSLTIVKDNEGIEFSQEYHYLSTPEVTERDFIGKITLAEITAALDSIPSDWTINELYIHNNRYCEVLALVDRSKNHIIRHLNEELFSVNENNYRFVISKPSVSYAMATICFLSSREDINIEQLIPMRPYFMSEQDAVRSLGDLINSLRWITVKATLPNDTTLAEYRKMIPSYLFNICYNQSTLFTIPDLHTTRQTKRRSIRRQGQLFPYRHYNSSLVKYYYQGLSIDIPFAQYLAFYHVAEYFFQTVAEDEAFKEIEDFITRPSFSPHRKEDLRRFYEKIKKRMRSQKENDVWDEKVGFLLCLKKYIPDLSVLKTSIQAIDTAALDYYKATKVSFADDANEINFDSTPDEVYACIRNRVYSVRNAIVHSKDGERLKYEPFKHDRELAKELPLVRAIAEEIIINASQAITLHRTDI